MSLNKAIASKKEHRKPYYGSKSISKSCRNHGSCPWCEENRKYKNCKREQAMLLQLKDFMKEN